MISDAMKERFAREVAKYPTDQKQSAVMACLAMVQQEFGHVSQQSELEVADYLGMPVIAVHADRDVELQPVIHLVRLLLAQIPGDP